MEKEDKRRLAWEVYKWIRKNDPNLSLKTNRDLYFIVEKITIEYYEKMAPNHNIPLNEIKRAMEKLADVENKYVKSDFKMDIKTVNYFLEN